MIKKKKKSMLKGIISKFNATKGKEKSYDDVEMHKSFGVWNVTAKYIEQNLHILNVTQIF